MQVYTLRGRLLLRDSMEPASQKKWMVMEKGMCQTCKGEGWGLGRRARKREGAFPVAAEGLLGGGGAFVVLFSFQARGSQLLPHIWGPYASLMRGGGS